MPVYLQERIDIAPGKIDAYFEVLEKNWDRVAELGPRCMGVWRTAGSYGKWNEVYILWEFEDWPHYGRVMTKHSGAGVLVHWVDQDSRLHVGGEGMTMVGMPESPTLDEMLKNNVKGTLFIHEYIRVLPGKRLDYVKYYVDNFLPLTRQEGRELVGIWALTAHANDVLMMLALKDWEDHSRAMGGGARAPSRKNWQVTAPDVRSDYDLRILVPGPKVLNPLSP